MPREMTTNTLSGGFNNVEFYKRLTKAVGNMRNAAREKRIFFPGTFNHMNVTQISLRISS
jgi:hypothetical protein